MWSKYVRSTLLAPFKSVIVFLTVVTTLHIRCPELTSIHLKTGSLYPWTTAHLVSISPPRPWKPLCYPLFVSSSFWVSTRKWDDTVFVVFKQQVLNDKNQTSQQTYTGQQRHLGQSWVQDPQALVTNYDLGSKELQKRKKRKKSSFPCFLH